MPLETYRRKRDFTKTPEPSGAEPAGGRPPTGSRRFVVQRHRATRLHYDFRLEMGGVLVSWAVPKGPSLNPKDRRMAVHVEDHPVSYFDFEGVIPKGEYGGGDVVVWDWGTWEPEETNNPVRAVHEGELKFSLNGEKLKGRFTIVKTRSFQSGQDDWLLIHKADDYADPNWNVDDYPRSVKTGRTNDEVKAGADAVWDSRAPAAEANIDLTGAREAKLPDFIDPMKATAVDKAFTDPEWLFEVKFDGYRVETVIDGRTVKMWTRGKQNAATYFPDLAAMPPAWITAQTAIVDGEVVAVDEEGNPSFKLLQARAGPLRGRPEQAAPIVYYVFDLLYHDGRSLLDVPLEHPVVRYAGDIEADGEAFLEVVKQRRLEGMVAKLRTSPYEAGRRSRYWLKIKVRREQEVVVVGYEPGQRAAKELGSLLVAVNEDGKLHYAGEVGSGYDQKARTFWRRELDKLHVDEPPVVGAPRNKSARWAKPEYVIRVEFTDWTAENLLRQPAYKGIDAGRDPREVTREREVSAKQTVVAAEKSVPKPRAARRVKAIEPAPTVESAPSGESARSAESVPVWKGLPQGASIDELAALESLGEAGTWEIGGQTVSVSNLNKVLFPEPGYTKRDLIRYYVSIAPTMLPYVRDRALNLWRWPDGVTGGHFWQKEIPAYAPPWIDRWTYPEARSSESHTYLVADQVATMAWLANHATIDMHPWTSKTIAYRNPTYALVDIDPGPETTFDQIVALARLYRAALGHLGVKGFPKTTGKRGLQVWIPIKPKYSFDETRAWVEGISRAVGATLPDLVSWEWEKTSRRGKARLDYTQNAVNKTLVAPYAVRPVAAASVSAPIAWDELDDPELAPGRWDLRSVFDRLRTVGDLFAGILELEQDLPPLD
jgi:bifunctional non-homologous end joining protein LigD